MAEPINGPSGTITFVGSIVDPSCNASPSSINCATSPGETQAQAQRRTVKSRHMEVVRESGKVVSRTLVLEYN